VEHLHQQQVEGFAGGVLGRGLLELGQHGAVVTGGDPRREPALHGAPAEGEQAGPLRCEHEGLGQVGEGLAAPQGQRVGEDRRRRRGLGPGRGLGASHQVGEADDVDLIGCHHQPVPDRFAPHDVGPDLPAKA
jgi:hypothetical protein